MLEFESKRKLKKRIYSKLTLIILSLVFLFLATGTWDIYQKQREVKKDLSMTENKLNESLKQKEMIKEKIERLDTNVGLEEALRENYSLAKEGEKAIFLIDEEEPPLPPVEEKSFFGRITSFFGGLFN